MEIIDISSNKISQDITDQVKGQNLLAELRVNFNKLSNFPNFTDFWLTNSSFRILDLCENKIRSMPREYYATLKNLQTFNIGGNKTADIPTILNVSSESLEILNVS